jgi:hypothetical protein
VSGIFLDKSSVQLDDFADLIDLRAYAGIQDE